jgi:hypothetical protein
MADVKTSQVNVKRAPVNMDHGILNADRSLEDKELLNRPFLWKPKNTNVEGRWKLKDIILYGEKSWTTALIQMKFCIIKFHL